MKNYFKSIATSSGLILTVIALFVTLWQLNEAFKHTEKLSGIKESISTRYIDEFPYYFPQIVNLLNEAQSSIMIAVDVPAYASFSSRDNWIKYKHILEQKAYDNVQVQMICYNDSLRRLFLNDQLSNVKANWENWKNDIDNITRINNYLNHRDRNKLIENLQFYEFLDLVEIENKEVLTNDLKSIDIKESNSNIPIFFWIIDGKKAIFAIPSQSENYKTYGFFTSDLRLIETYQSIINRFYKDKTTSP